MKRIEHLGNRKNEPYGIAEFKDCVIVCHGKDEFDFLENQIAYNENGEILK